MLNVPLKDFQRSQAFNEVAEIYDSARPGYPVKLIEDIIELTNLPTSAKILDIGTGTGKGTVPFAEKGYTIHCLDPGEKLIAIASQNLRSFPLVTFETATFEDWNCTSSAFNLVISAQAFHWVNREIGYPKAASVLKPGGHIALFWNFFTPSDTPVSRALNQAYQECVPSSDESQPSISSLIDKRQNWINDSKCFKNLIIQQYPWLVEYNAEQYLNLIKTQTIYQKFTELEKQNLTDAVVRILSEYGGYITKSYLTVLFFAQKDG